MFTRAKLIGHRLELLHYVFGRAFALQEVADRFHFGQVRLLKLLGQLVGNAGLVNPRRLGVLGEVELIAERERLQEHEHTLLRVGARGLVREQLDIKKDIPQQYCTLSMELQLLCE